MFATVLHAHISSTKIISFTHLSSLLNERFFRISDAVFLHNKAAPSFTVFSLNSASLFTILKCWSPSRKKNKQSVFLLPLQRSIFSCFQATKHHLWRQAFSRSNFHMQSCSCTINVDNTFKILTLQCYLPRFDATLSVVSVRGLGFMAASSLRIPHPSSPAPRWFFQWL